MRIVVTGASGFVGRAIARTLVDAGHDVMATSLSRPVRVSGARAAVCDIREPRQLERVVEGADAVVHCAALVGPCHRTAELESTNVTGTANVVRAASDEGIGHLVHVSSTSVMDEYREHHGSDESHPYPERPRDAYTRTKIEAERWVLDHSDGMALTVLRPGWVWGPGAPGMRGLLRALDRGLFVTPGDGDNLLHLVYVDNLASVVPRVVSERPIGTFIITDGPGTTLRTFASCLSRHLGADGRTGTVPFGLAYALSTLIEPFGLMLGRGLPNRLQVSNLGLSHHYDVSRARTRLGLSPSIGLEEGSARTVEWYRGMGP